MQKNYIDKIYYSFNHIDIFHMGYTFSNFCSYITSVPLVAWYAIYVTSSHREERAKYSKFPLRLFADAIRSTSILTAFLPRNACIKAVMEIVAKIGANTTRLGIFVINDAFDVFVNNIAFCSNKEYPFISARQFCDHQTSHFFLHTLSVE